MAEKKKIKYFSPFGIFIIIVILITGGITFYIASEIFAFKDSLKRNTKISNKRYVINKITVPILRDALRTSIKYIYVSHLTIMLNINLSRGDADFYLSILRSKDNEIRAGIRDFFLKEENRKGVTNKMQKEFKKWLKDYLNSEIFGLKDDDTEIVTEVFAEMLEVE